MRMITSTGSERDRAHFFLRIVVHREDAADPTKSSMSHVHLVDLIGDRRIESGDAAKKRKEKIGKEKKRIE